MHKVEKILTGSSCAVNRRTVSRREVVDRVSGQLQTGGQGRPLRGGDIGNTRMLQPCKMWRKRVRVAKSRENSPFKGSGAEAKGKGELVGDEIREAPWAPAVLGLPWLW